VKTTSSVRLTELEKSENYQDISDRETFGRNYLLWTASIRAARSRCISERRLSSNGFRIIEILEL
jgi:hypothetical protein